jgi:hypothetical protein
MSDTITNQYGDLIEVGQTWADNDPRCLGRTVRIVAIERGYIRRAICEVVTVGGGEPPSKPREVRIKVDRLHPTSTGYRLVSDPGAFARQQSREAAQS